MSLLEIADVTVRFGGNIALDGASLSAVAGSVTGLIGPNGAGKTTMFNVITGLQPVNAGTVELDGVELNSVPPFRRARAGIARTFQRLESFGSMTVRENVLVAAELGHEKHGMGPGAFTDSLIARLSLGDVADERADGLPTGRARLVEIARALATNPKVLLLDEPASGLSDTETEDLAVLLSELAEGGLAVLLVEHDVPLVMQVCERIYVLDFGAILAQGTAQEIQSNPCVQEAYLGATA